MIPRRLILAATFAALLLAVALVADIIVRRTDEPGPLRCDRYVDDVVTIVCQPA